MTKEAQRQPEELVQLSNNFIKFNRRMIVGFEESKALATALVPDQPVRRIRASQILNMDETPLPFEIVDNYTYDTCGKKTISIRTEHSGWSKRQATLILYIFADSVGRLLPKLIFHGKDEAAEISKIRKKEEHLYDPRVTVEFNKEAYNNGELMKKWAREELPSALHPNEPALLVMDHASFHKTDEVMHTLRANQVVTSMIPAGCTGILQPLDVAINKPFKDRLRDLLDEAISRCEAEEHAVNTASSRRILLTEVVGEAWQWLCDQKQQMVIDCFKSTGINIEPDGTEDHLIRIKDIDQGQIDLTGWALQDDAKEVELEPIFDDGDEYDVSQPLAETLREKIIFMNCVTIRQRLKERQLSTAGRKIDLVARLVQHEEHRLKDHWSQSIETVDSTELGRDN